MFIAAVIALYSGWVLYGKYKQYKAGNFCSCSGGCGSCSCAGCAGKASCGK
ncbi:MAG: hypothetical protein IKZ26_07540 [Peptococcaceae bacterium]|nr:hypothetical protein [Peptococcaceae bacterium]